MTLATEVETRRPPMTFGSLFSGIGGMDLGLERAGLQCRWQVEIDPYCNRVLEKHWPNVKRYGDIRELAGRDLEIVDIIAGGFPCQPVSGAGKRLGEDDERWLWPEFLRIVCVLRPSYVLVENVSGLTRRGMARVLGGLAESGFDAEWQSIPAAAVGAPHIRDRVWILAYPRPEPGRDEWRPDDGDGRTVVLPQGNNRQAAEWSEHRELFALVPGIHPGVASDWWLHQSGVARTVNGLPRQLVDARNCGLGNAVVPQVAQFIGERILESLSVKTPGVA